MPTTKGNAIAAPQIFGSDPLEQIFAKGVIGGDPSMSGIAGALMLAAGLNRSSQQDTYMQQLQNANSLSAKLQQQEMQARAFETAMKEGHHYTGQGFQPADIPALGAHFSDPRAESVTQVPTSIVDLRKAQIQKALADAAKAKAEGKSAGGLKIKGVHDTSIYGSGESTYTVQGSDAAAITRELDRLAVADYYARTGKMPPPGQAPRARLGQADSQKQAEQAARRKRDNID